MRHYNKSSDPSEGSQECLCILSRSLCYSQWLLKGYFAGGSREVPHLKSRPHGWDHRFLGYCFTCANCVFVTLGDVGGNVPADTRVAIQEGFGYPARCSDCNTQLKRWRRSRDWADGIIEAKARQPRGRKRLFFVTFTERDEPICRTGDEPTADRRRWEGVDDHASRKTLDLVERCRRLFRTAAWKRHFDGHLWGAECTIRPDAETWCEYRAFTHDEEDCTRKVWLNRLVWKVHPHLHVVAIGRRWDLDELDELASRYGLRSNIRMIDNRRSVKRAIRYLTKYTVKEMPIVKSHSTAGVFRSVCAELKEARRLEMLQDRE